MIILIAGASHTGKTLLAQRLLEKYGYPYLSIDHLKMGLIRSGYTSLTPESCDRDLTDYLWPVVREIIKTAIENRQNLIVEGCYIPFDWVGDFEEAYRVQIQYRCLVMSEAYIRAHYHDIKTYASAIEHRVDDEGCTLESLIRDNAGVLEQCRKYGVEYTLIDGTYVKTLSAMLGHVSAATTLDIYTHVTDTMQTEAAARIDRGLGNEIEETDSPEEPLMTDFQPVGDRIRRPGTGCITEINDHLFEGRYSPTWPDGKRHAKNVYAKTRAECEEKLNALIREMQAERQLLLDQIRGIIPPEKLTKKQKQIWEYMMFHPRETNLSAIARGAGVNRHTAAKHYEQIREMVGYG